MAGAAHAQQVTGPKDDSALQEIVVTAQRRTERLQDVPVSVTALQGSDLQDSGIRNSQDIARITPGLYFAPSGGLLDSGVTPTIRGIGNAGGAGATVGVYLEDVPLQVRTDNNAYNSELKIFDIDRVELLRGPQGTLFGASSLGGTIRYLTPQPSFTGWSGNVRADGGKLSGGTADYHIGAAGGGPISDKVAIRGSIYYERQSGYINQLQRSTGTELEGHQNSDHSVAARVAATIKVTDSFKLTPSVYFQRTDRNGIGVFQVNLPAFSKYNTSPELGKDRLTVPSLTAEWDFGRATLTSVTSYVDRVAHQDVDYSTIIPAILTAADFFPGFEDNYHSISRTLTTQKNFTQEIRLASNGANSLRWQVGAIYFRDSQEFDQDVIDNTIDLAVPAIFGGAPVSAIFGFPTIPGPDGPQILVATKGQIDTVYARFGEVGYKVLPKLEVTGGIRVSGTKLEFNRAADGPVNGGATSFVGEEKATPVTPKFAIAYKPDDDLNLYFTAQRGFRAGGVSEAVPLARCASDIAAWGGVVPSPNYSPDTVWSYEVGAKSQFADRRVALNASIYRVNWNNIQQNITLPHCGYGYTVNLGQARSQGFELETAIHPISGLSIGGRIGYTDAKFTSTSILAGVTLSGDGDRVPNVPKTTFNLNSEYRFPVAGGVKALVRAEYDYVGSSFRTLPAGRAGYNPLYYDAQSYSVVGLRAGVEIDSGWDVSVFANNLTNRQPLIGAATNLSPNPQTLYGSTLRPREIGLTIARKF